MMTKQQIQDMYQDSVLCQTTRRAKENGSWFLKNYVSDINVDNISEAQENPTFERKERAYLLKTA